MAYAFWLKNKLNYLFLEYLSEKDNVLDID